MYCFVGKWVEFIIMECVVVVVGNFVDEEVWIEGGCRGVVK